MTTFTVSSTARPISEAMFADLGVPLVTFSPTTDGGVQVDSPEDLDPLVVIRARMRLLTANLEDEAVWVSALGAQAADLAYLATPPAADPLAAQVYELTRQVLALMQYIGRDALR